MPLHGRQFDVGAVAPFESGDVDAHFLSFKRGRDTSGEDNHVCLADAVDYRSDGFFFFVSQVEVQLRIAPGVFKVNLYVVTFPFFHLQGISCFSSPVRVLETSHFGAVDVQFATSVCIEFQ